MNLIKNNIGRIGFICLNALVSKDECSVHQVFYHSFGFKQMERGPPVRGVPPLESTLARLSHLVLDPRLPEDFREEVLNRVRIFYCELQDLAQQFVVQSSSPVAAGERAQPPESGGSLREERSRPSLPGRKQEKEHQKEEAKEKEHKKFKSAKQVSEKEAPPSITPANHDTKDKTSKEACHENKRKEKAASEESGERNRERRETPGKEKKAKERSSSEESEVGLSKVDVKEEPASDCEGEEVDYSAGEAREDSEEPKVSRSRSHRRDHKRERKTRSRSHRTRARSSGKNRREPQGRRRSREAEPCLAVKERGRSAHARGQQRPAEPEGPPPGIFVRPDRGRSPKNKGVQKRLRNQDIRWYGWDPWRKEHRQRHFGRPRHGR